MSTALRVGNLLLVGLIGAGAPGCGWRWGPVAGTGLHLSAVQGATVEPGLRAALADGVQRALSAQGVPSGGPGVVLTVVSIDHRPDASVPSTGTVAWTGLMVVDVRVSERPDCQHQVNARRVWIRPAGEPRAAAAVRAEAVAVLAQEVSSRAIDLVLGDPRCR